jgi:hypothetical protein
MTTKEIFGWVFGILIGVAICVGGRSGPAHAQSLGQNVRLYLSNPTTGTWEPVASDGAAGLRVGGYSASNLTTNTTTTLKTGAGLVHCLAVNTGGVTSTATLYDNVAGSGTKLGTVATTTAGVTVCSDVKFATGLTVVTAGGGAAADLTVGWR